MPVIKNNAYGHGITRVAKYLESEKVKAVCVGKFEEAATLRRHGFKGAILNLGPFSRKEAEVIVSQEITQSVFSDAAMVLNEAAGRIGKRAAVHVKIDTGLGRVGVPHEQALEFVFDVARLEHIEITGVFTALSEDIELDLLQLRRFGTVCDQAAKRGIHLGIRHAASSAGILNHADSLLDVVRPGIAVFGHYPSGEAFRQRKIDLKPALSLKARVSMVKSIKPGEAVGYHQAYVAKSLETIVTGAIGYPDGYPPNLAGKSHAIVRERMLPVIGAVTANHITLGAGDSRDIRIGDEIVLIGLQGDCSIALEELTQLSGLSEYKLLSMINPLLPRFYRIDGMLGPVEGESIDDIQAV